MDRVQIKENAKARLQAKNNLSAAIGAELLVRFVLSGISSVVLTVSITGVLRGILDILSEVVGGVRDAILSVFPYGIIQVIFGLIPDFDFADMLSGAMSSAVSNLGLLLFLVAPVSIGLSRYFLHMIEKDKRPRVLTVFEGFENYRNVVVVWISKWLRVTLLPSIVFFMGTGLVTFMCFMSISTIVSSSLSNYNRSEIISEIISSIMLPLLIWIILWFASVALRLYMWVKTWAMQWILAENMDVTSAEALEASARMIEGHFWDLIVFELSFWGWKILSYLTFGLVGVFYVNPYYDMASALLYQELKGEAVAVKSAYEDDPAIDCGSMLSQLKKANQKIRALESRVESLSAPSQPEIGILGVTGMYAGSLFPLQPDETVTIGRDKNVSQIVFVNGAEKISRRHCTVRFSSKDQKYHVTDYSSNGTYIDGTALPKEQPVIVERGSSLALGNTNNVVRLL